MEMREDEESRKSLKETPSKVSDPVCETEIKFDCNSVEEDKRTNSIFVIVVGDTMVKRGELPMLETCF